METDRISATQACEVINEMGETDFINVVCALLRRRAALYQGTGMITSRIRGILLDVALELKNI